MATGDRASTRDRVRYLLSSYFTLALAVCVVMALGGLVVAVGAHTGPDTTTDQRVVGTWTTESDFRHAAVVQRDVRPFDEGAVLSDRSTYISSVTPVLNGSYVYEHGGDAETATVRTDLVLVVRSVSRIEEQGVLWRETRPLETAETPALGANETHRVPFEVNVSAQLAFARTVQETLDTTSGRIEVLIVAETTAETTLEGEQLVDAREERLEAVPGSGTYSVATNVSGDRGKQVTGPVEVPVETDPLSAYGSVVAVVVGLAGIGMLLRARREGALDLSPTTRSSIRLRSERDSFEEWISNGRVPPVTDAERVVVVDSLADLVDVAIDSERRVIEDADSGAFVIFDGATRYEFRPEGPGRLLSSSGGSSPENAPPPRDVDEVGGSTSDAGEDT